MSKQRNVFDVQAMLPDPFPPKFAAGYLNNASVQAALGVPLNFTGQSVAVASGMKRFSTHILAEQSANTHKFFKLLAISCILAVLTESHVCSTAASKSRWCTVTPTSNATGSVAKP